jgi:hypothetical protein
LRLKLFQTFAFFLIFVSAMKIVIANEPELPQLSPQMVQDDFEPSVARLFLLVDFRVVEDASSLELGPLFAEASFEEMLPSDFVLGVDQHSEDGFAIVGVHLEVLVGESAPNALD